MCIKRPEFPRMKDLALDVNIIPLSKIPDTKQILLPPQEHSLIRNNFQIYTEDLLKQLNINSNSNENIIDKNDKISEKASQLNDVNDDYLKQRGLKNEEISRPVQTVLRRKKNREVKISLEMGRDRKREREANDDQMENVLKKEK